MAHIPSASPATVHRRFPRLITIDVREQAKRMKRELAEFFITFAAVH
jgi:hypothetical protein